MYVFLPVKKGGNALPDNDTALSAEVSPTIVKVPYDTHMVKECLPSVGEGYYKEMDVVDQIRTKIKAYRHELSIIDKVCSDIFQLLKN